MGTGTGTEKTGPVPVPVPRRSLLSREVEYQMSVVSIHKDPLGRKLREGSEIIACNQTILLNSKEEFLQGAVPSTRTQSS